MLSYGALLILNIKSSSKYLKWVVIPRSVTNIGAASLVMGGLVFLVNHFCDSAVVACIVGVVVGITVYTGMLLVLREFSRGEILQVTGFVKSKWPWGRRP
jgi:hypothetical protein